MLCALAAGPRGSWASAPLAERKASLSRAPSCKGRGEGWLRAGDTCLWSPAPGGCAESVRCYLGSCGGRWGEVGGTGLLRLRLRPRAGLTCQKPHPLEFGGLVSPMKQTCFSSLIGLPKRRGSRAEVSHSIPGPGPPPSTPTAPPSTPTAPDPHLRTQAWGCSRDRAGESALTEP